MLLLPCLMTSSLPIVDVNYGDIFEHIYYMYRSPEASLPHIASIDAVKLWVGATIPPPSPFPLVRKKQKTQTSLHRVN